MNEKARTLSADGSLATRVWQHRGLYLFILLAAGIPLGYALYTGHIWEDYFITFRHSQNLVEGKGLVYNPGERVHGFTSPLGVLLPALCYLATGKSGYLPALWLFRVLSVAAFVTGGVLVLRRLNGTRANRPVVLAFALLYLLDVKGVANAVDGMETGFMMLFVGWALSLFDRQGPRVWLMRGLAWAGLMWTRPDGCVYIAALSLAELVFGTGDRRRLLGSLARSALVTTVLYLPWLLFATSYYGSPIPQTIQAKTPAGETRSVGQILDKIYLYLPHRAAVIFGPIYFPLFWPGPTWTYWLSYILGISCLIYWLVPVQDPVGRMASLCFTLLSVYVSYMALPFPWYLPPMALFGWVALARGTVTIARTIVATASTPPEEAGRVADLLTIIFLAPLAMGLAGLFGLTTREIKIQEREIEMGNRVPMGLWLKEHMQPGETLFLEPIGYVGYFSQAHIRDWPGLVSPQVVELRARGAGLETVPTRLEPPPEWVVYRAHEAKLTLLRNPDFGRIYVPVKVFDVKERLKQCGPIPGSPYLVLDATFIIFRLGSADRLPPSLRADHEEAQQFLARLMAERDVPSGTSAP